MKRAVFVALLLAAPTAQGQAPPPAGWERTTIQQAPVFQTAALACGRDRAYVRDYAGDVRAFDGRSWAPIARAPSRGRHLWVSPAGRIVVDGPSSLHAWDGARWSDVAIDPWFAVPQRGGGALFAIDGLGERPWVLGRGAIGLDVGSDEGVLLRAHDVASSAWYALSDLEVLAPDRVYVASEAGLLRWDGRAWSVEPTGIEGEVGGVHAFAADDVWAFSDAGVAHFDGRGWTLRTEGLELPEPRPLRYYPSETRVHVGGRPGAVYLSTPDRVYRLDGARWAVELDASHHDSPHSRSYGEICATDRFVIVSAGGSAFIGR